MSMPNGQYATDVTDAQWQRIEPLRPAPRWRLNSRWSLQEVWPQALDRLTQRERRLNGRAATLAAGEVDDGYRGRAIRTWVCLNKKDAQDRLGSRRQTWSRRECRGPH